jgi:hypothetical protein
MVTIRVGNLPSVRAVWIGDCAPGGARRLGRDRGRGGRAAPDKDDASKSAAMARHGLTLAYGVRGGLSRNDRFGVMSDALGRHRALDNVRYASDSDRIAAPPRSAASGHNPTRVIAFALPAASRLPQSMKQARCLFRAACRKAQRGSLSAARSRGSAAGSRTAHRDRCRTLPRYRRCGARRSSCKWRVPVPAASPSW